MSARVRGRRCGAGADERGEHGSTSRWAGRDRCRRHRAASSSCSTRAVWGARDLTGGLWLAPRIGRKGAISCIAKTRAWRASGACSTTSGRPASPVSARIVASVGKTAQRNSWSQIVEGEAEVDVLGPVDQVVDTVVVGADEHPLEYGRSRAGCSSARNATIAPYATSTVVGQRAVGDEHEAGDARRRGTETWMSGWVRNTVRTLMSSCEWCSSWKRHSARMRWFARCDEPVARIHRDDDRRDDPPAWHRPERR